MATGAEDTPNWNHPTNKPGQQKYNVCRRCKQKLDIAHCVETGCPWCNACGETVRFKKE